MKKAIIFVFTVLILTASSCVPTTTEKLGKAGAECILIIATQGVGVDAVIDCLKTARVELTDPEVLAEIKEQLLKHSDSKLMEILAEVLLPSEPPSPVIMLQSVDQDVSFRLVVKENVVESILDSLAKRLEQVN